MRILLLFFAFTLFADTNHLLQLDQEMLPYTAQMGFLPVKDQNGEEKGEIHYTAYFKEEKGRPITFFFNGGPGSSSVWLHIGAFGPRRVLSPEEGQAPVPPYQIVDNKETLLDMTDLVFVDPIGTGLSHGKTPEDEKFFSDSNEDVHSIGDFIRDFLTLHKRWNSPLYLAGESYGTFRCCGLADYLQTKHGIFPNGIILISCAIDFQTRIDDSENWLPYPLFLPTYALTAWYHGRYRPEATLEEIVEESQKFAFETYAPALLRPSQADWEPIYEKLAILTGLPLQAVKKANGKIGDQIFFTNFFPEEQQTVGRFDTRITGLYTPPFLTGLQDPSCTSIWGIFSGAFQKYIEQELEAPASYSIFSEKVNLDWVYKTYAPFGYPNFMEGLRRALIANSSLKVFVAMGYFDAATPFTATEYSFDHLNLPTFCHCRIQKGYYEGGHMFYLNPSVRTQLKQDLVRFYLR